MSRVVRAVDDGIVMLGDDSTDIVQYIIFEPADGDLRKLISTFADIDLAWAITITHQSAVGLMQLHTQNIAHQDLKPSNVLSFAGKANAKIADLGCASRSGFRSPRDTLCIPGARQYAAPELVYGQMDRDWRVRRLAPDLFQLGSLICFLYTGKLMLATMLPHVPLEFRPSGFGGDFRGRYADAQPFIYDSFVKALNEVRPSFSGNISEAMFELMGKLCDPNPATRGAGGPKWSGANQYSLTPFVSRLGILQARAQYAVKTCLRQIDGDYSAG